MVDILFDPKVITFETLLTTARKVDCLHNVYARTDAQVDAAKKAGEKVARNDEASRPAKDSDRWYYLKKSPAKALTLTPAQATKVNAAIGLKQDPTPWLTPSQAAAYAKSLKR